MPSLPPSLRHRRLQPIWQGLHKLSLQGMNFGGGTDVESSGEATFLARTLRGQSRPLVLDVGANRGHYVEAILAANPTAIVHAFEPSPVIYAELTARLAGHANVTCWPLALGAQAGTATLQWPEGHDGLASMTRRDLSEVGLEVDQAVDVPVQTLDGWAEEHGVESVRLLKVDVEGHEADVLKGARSLLSAGRIETIQFEFGGTGIDTRTFLRDVIGALGPGYEVRRMLPKGLSDPIDASERNEIFVLHNYVATKRS